MSSMQTLPTTQSCFVCGRANPIGLKLHFQTDGETVQTHFTPSSSHVGFKGVIHGGILATLLDEVMVWACGVRTNRFAYCAEMTVRYLQPARPGEKLIAVGKLVENRRNRIFEASGELRNEANLLIAASTGKYLPIPSDELAGMLDEFESGPVGIFGTSPAES